MIIVTGATGHFGRAVVEDLLKRVPASNIGVSVRDPQRAADLGLAGVRVRKGDFAEPATLAEAFDGAEQVLITSVNIIGPEVERQHGNAIEAAHRAGARRILYTSHQAANPSSAVAFARDHAATEALLEATGLSFVSLRNGFYTESSLYQLIGLATSRRIALPEDGQVSWTARQDLAVAAAATLANPALLDGISPPLTASETVTFADFANIASTLLGQPVARELLTDDQYRDLVLSRGFPAPMVGMLLSMFQAMRNAEFDVVDPTLERILARRPTSVAEILRGFLDGAQTA